MVNDFHTHSSESDGSLTPGQLIVAAVEQGLSTIALCDHDTTSGLTRFHAQADAKGINAIPGIEVSSAWEQGNCHLLGLGITPGYGPLETVLEQTRESREGRNGRILEMLDRLGMHLDDQKVREHAGGAVVARPHIARAMVDAGYAGSVQEAFERYLGKGKAAYADRFRLAPSKAVELLTRAGALVVLAHPVQLCLDLPSAFRFIQELQTCGLGGLEVYTPYANDDDVKGYYEIARSLGLVVTGGSDFHGDSKPDHRLGHYRPHVPIPPLSVPIPPV
jgi:3',5'-nucleoside bisphosphate phosphatase